MNTPALEYHAAAATAVAAAVVATPFSKEPVTDPHGAHWHGPRADCLRGDRQADRGYH